MQIVNAQTMQTLDRTTTQTLGIPGMVLMERAALGIVQQIQQHFQPSLQPVNILAGPGNNGGDGLAIARLLHCLGIPVQIWLNSDGPGSPEYQHQLTIVQALKLPVSTLKDDLRPLATALNQSISFDCGCLIWCRTQSPD